MRRHFGLKQAAMWLNLFLMMWIFISYFQVIVTNTHWSTSGEIPYWNFFAVFTYVANLF